MAIIYTNTKMNYTRRNLKFLNRQSLNRFRRRCHWIFKFICRLYIGREFYDGVYTLGTATLVDNL